MTGPQGDDAAQGRLPAADDRGTLLEVDARPLAEIVPDPTAAEALRALTDAVQRLSLADGMQDVQHVVRRAARRLTGADGATFVLRDGGDCHYADEEAIAPLWKGKRFPLQSCISGWAMLNRKPAVIEDIRARRHRSLQGLQRPPRPPCRRRAEAGRHRSGRPRKRSRPVPPFERAEKPWRS